MPEITLLNKYLPPNTAEYVLKLLKRYPVYFKIVAPRKTKLGDFKVYNKTGKLQITINNDLKPLNFLITTIHELAHLYNWKMYKNDIDPHGEEWKNEYKKLFLPILSTQFLSQEEVNLLQAHLNNPKASSCADVMLKKHFKKEGVVHLEDVPFGKYFNLDGRMFSIEKKLRKRYLCVEQSSGRKYYINGLAEVENVTIEEAKQIEGCLTNSKLQKKDEINAVSETEKKGIKYLKDVPIGEIFFFQKKLFRNDKKLRTRFLCTEQSTDRKYYINGQAKVFEM